jgi:hypothetical protein
MANASMNVRKLSQAIGARVLVTFPVGSGSLKSNGYIGVYCLVRDVRKVYDRVDLLVMPESGTGEGWVSMTRVERTNDGVCDFALATV